MPDEQVQVSRSRSPDPGVDSGAALTSPLCSSRKATARPSRRCCSWEQTFRPGTGKDELVNRVQLWRLHSWNVTTVSTTVELNEEEEDTLSVIRAELMPPLLAAAEFPFGFNY